MKMRVPFSLLQHPGAPEFLREFMEEHLSELEFLLGQRHQCVRDTEVPWPELADMEQRIEAHVDAMRAGEDVALDLAREAMLGGDDAQVMVGVNVVASFQETEGADGLGEVLQALEEAASDLLGIWEEVLVLLEHSQVVDRITPLLASQRPEVRAVAARVLGRRHEGNAGRIFPLADDAFPEVRNAAVMALARLDYRPALTTIEHLLPYVPIADWEPLTFAALYLGSPRALRHCRQACQSGGEFPAGFPRLLAMAGDERDLPLLQRLCTHPKLVSNTILALGILGIPSSIPFLIEQLSADGLEVRLATGAALNLITGAGLYVTTRLREEGTDGPELGRKVHLPNTDPTTWTKWWDDHQPRFSSARRFRLGKPFSLGVCIEELADPRSSFEARKRAAHELRIHSGQAIGFEPDWPIRRQHAAISRWQRWWAEHGSRSTRR